MSELINNKQQRIDTMKSLIRRLHQGEETDSIKNELAKQLESVEYSDVFLMENQLIAEGIPVENIRNLCDVHTLVLRKQLDQQLPIDSTPGHPLHTLLNENRAIENTIIEIEKGIDNFNSDRANFIKHIINIHKNLNDLTDIDKHYRKKEELIFPFFEKNGFTGPTNVMWAKDDEVRDMLKETISAMNELRKAGLDEVASFFELGLKPTLESIKEMIYKEEKIMLPMAKELLKPNEWFMIHEQIKEIGYCLYVPSVKWAPKGVQPEELDIHSNLDGKIILPSGIFKTNELIAMLNTLPFDLTLVDKNDTVIYFSEGPDRVFSRTRTIIGRKVQNCHPPDSVHIVNQILDDFRSGKQSMAKFWIKMMGKFVYIVYYAVRSEEGEYLGTLEVTQDISEIQKIDGERRLLSYE